MPPHHHATRRHRRRTLIVPALLALGAARPSATHVAIPLTLTFAPSTVIGGTSTTGTITLGTPAPSTGTVVTIANPAGTTIQAGTAQVGIQSIGSTRVAIGSGQTTLSFRVLTAGVAASTVATFTATSGSDQTTATLTLNPASLVAISIAPSAVVGGTGATATITLSGPAPAGTGVTVQLSALTVGTLADGSVRVIGTSSLIGIPTTAHVPPGTLSVAVPITTSPVGFDQTIEVAATLGNVSRSAMLTIKMPRPTSVLLSSGFVVAGDTVTGTVVMDGPAPLKGLSVPLSASNPNATVPTSITISTSATRQTFLIATPVLTNFGATGNSVTISALPRSTAPLTGTTSTISDGTSNTIVASQSPAASATLTLLPAITARSVAAAPSPVTGGTPIAVTLTFSSALTFLTTSAQQPAPSGALTTVQLAVDQPTLVQLPQTVSVPETGGVVTVNGTTTIPAADQTVTISATVHATTASTTLTVKKPILALATFTLRPTTVTGGLNLLASFQLTPAMTSAQIVTLSTDRPDVIQLPPTVTVPVSQVPTPFTFKTTPVTAQTTATITATAGGQRIPIAITIVP
jgi:hypothetical protein